MPIGVSNLYLEPGALYKVFPVRQRMYASSSVKLQTGKLSHLLQERFLNPHLKTGKRVVALPSLSGLALRARAGCRPWPERRGRARAGGLLQTSSQLLAKVHGSCACLAKSGSAVSLRCRFF